MRWVLVVLLAVVMVAAGCSSDDDAAEDATTTTTVEETEVQTTTVPPAEVSEAAFTFADDDLCVWVSEDEVAEFVAAEFEWDGTAVLHEVPQENEDIDCEWILTSTAGDVGDVTAGNAGTWKDGAYDFGALEVVDFDEELEFTSPGSAASGHPSLSDGVVVHNGAFGQYAFWVPPSDEYLSLSMGFEDDVEPVLVEGDFQARLFGVADRFVQELGWLG